MSPERIGVFGGTFDPPHVGHLILAAEAFSELKLDRLLWVLTPVPPHKLDQHILTAEHRLAMLRLALGDNPDFELSSVEIDRPGPHYTVDTLHLLAGQHPSADLILLIGGDSLRDMPTWHRAPDIVAACRQIGVMRRSDDAINLPEIEAQVPGVQAKVRFVDALLLEISSRTIRRRIREKRPFRYYLSPPVFEYIQAHNLYR